MTKLNAGTPVKSGYYFNLQTWTIQPVETDGEMLPGEANEQWIPMSLPIAVAAAPILGAGFLMFMPFIGFYLTAKALTKPLVAVFHKTSAELAATMSPGLVPGESYLTGKKGEAEAAGAAESKELDALQSEIDANRKPKA